MPAILTLVSEVVANLPQLIQLGVDVTHLVTVTKNVIDEEGSPTDPQWAELDQKVNDLKARLAAGP